MSVVVLVVPDGAADPLGVGPTCLEAAATPTLDRLAGGGVLQRVRTIPAGLPAGTEVGVPGLLGIALAAAPARGLVEAAAAGVALDEGEHAWRLDLLPRSTPGADLLARLDAAVAEVGGRVHHLSGHRLLLVGPAWWGDAPPGPHQTEARLRDLAAGPFAGVAKAVKAALHGAPVDARIGWPWGAGPAAAELPDLPELLGVPVEVAAAGGAAAGVAALLGCAVARVDAVAGAQRVAAAPERTLVVVHDPEPDEAAHVGDRAGKVAALERFDAEVLAPVVGAVEARGGTVVVAPDHGCDPTSGRHTAEPVPAVTWRAGTPAYDDPHPPRVTERHVRRFRPVDAHELLTRPLQALRAAA